MYHAKAGRLIDWQDLFKAALTEHDAAGAFVHRCAVVLCCTVVLRCAVLCWRVLTAYQ